MSKEIEALQDLSKLVFVDGGVQQYQIIEKSLKALGIIKSADTIEELCDEFVVEDNYDFAIFNNLKLARQTKGTCYGAIWTKWGLKYVAKMNDKRELELL